MMMKLELLVLEEHNHNLFMLFLETQRQRYPKNRRGQFRRVGIANAAAAGSLAAFVAIGSGTAGCIVAGWLADRLGRARVAIWAMWTSAACAALSAAVFGRSPVWFFALAAVWGFAVVADSAQFSALVSEHAPPDHIGTALTLQTSLGFLLTMVTIEAMPRLAAVAGWQWTGLLLVPGPLAGIAAMQRLRPEDPASRTKNEERRTKNAT